MAGTLGHDAWRRSSGGVWLPRAFEMTEAVYGWCCCEAVSECDSCTDMPSQVEVVIAGLRASGCCNGWNGTFVLDKWITACGYYYSSSGCADGTQIVTGLSAGFSKRFDGAVLLFVDLVNAAYNTVVQYFTVASPAGSAPIDCRTISGVVCAYSTGSWCDASGSTATVTAL